jgi:hypothetical protein
LARAEVGVGTERRAEVLEGAGGDVAHGGTVTGVSDRPGPRFTFVGQG